MKEYSVDELIKHAASFASSLGFRFVMVKDENGDSISEKSCDNCYNPLPETA